MARVRLYIDGFNFYYAVRDLFELDRREFPLGLGWCDFGKLARGQMLRPDDVLVGIKYFTSRVSRQHANRTDEDIRQVRWLEAVATIDGLDIVWGFHQQPRNKKRIAKIREEKQTDVKIAVELLVDAINGDCERAIVVTGDIDQAPAVFAARERLPLRNRVEVDVWIPPGIEHRRWDEFAAEQGMVCKEITRDMLLASRLDDVITTKSGATVECLDAWRLPAGLEGLRWKSDTTETDVP